MATAYRLSTARPRATLLNRELRSALAAEAIVLGGVDGARGDELARLQSHFAQRISAVLTPIAVGPGQPFPYNLRLSSSLGVTVRDPEARRGAVRAVRVPQTLRRSRLRRA